MENTYVLIPIFCSLGMFAMISIIFLAVSNTRKHRAKLTAEVQSRMIDKFGTAPEFIGFLSTPAGREFMAGFESQPRLAARDRILKGIRSATVLTCLGLAFCALSMTTHERDLYIPGILLLGLGGGYIISTILMMRLSRSWGLLHNTPEDVPSYASVTGAQ